ncbi:MULTISPECIES: PqqD family protein [unclassified Streptomyces]|uniref:PqqD family protein n=1 Tax=unclassified Streptomyces TaxID=2593676 RepID=UPI0038148D9C
MSTINNNDVLVRRLDVTARVTDQVVDLSERPEGGVLLETLIGRYVLDSDGRVVWLLIDGRRDVAQVVEGAAERTGLPVAEVEQQVQALCGRLLELGLVERATPADSVPLAPAAVAG